MRYSIEPKNRIYVKGYGIQSFGKNIGKKLNNRYGQKVIDSAKKPTADAIRGSSKRAIQKFKSCNKISDKITSVSMKKVIEKKNINNEREVPKERQQIINEFRLVPKKDVYLRYISPEKDNKLLMN